tara:strand:- start:370 stop:549 length:180 start_codon:yes stop_codon:yes gene_type:complete
MPIVIKRNRPSYVSLAGGNAKVAPAETKHTDPEPDPEVIEAKAEKVSQSILDKILPRIN